MEPDEAGGIVIPVSTGSEGAVQEARYRLATEPTPYLYVQTAYAYSDASNAIIREMGLFMDTEFVEGLPEGQRYFTPADLKSPGLLLAAQIILPRINRSPSVRQTVEFVLPNLGPFPPPRHRFGPPFTSSASRRPRRVPSPFRGPGLGTVPCGL